MIARTNWVQCASVALTWEYFGTDGQWCYISKTIKRAMFLNLNGRSLRMV